MKLILLLLIVVVVAALLAALKRRTADKTPRGVYVLRKSLLTPAERSFFGVLAPLLPVEVRCFAKVGLDDIFTVKSGLTRSVRHSAFNRINRKHVDFLLVRANDLMPLAGIELDDSSHGAEHRKQRDAFVDDVFKSGGIPLLHLPAQKAYSLVEIRTKLAALLS